MREDASEVFEGLPGGLPLACDVLQGEEDAGELVVW